MAWETLNNPVWSALTSAQSHFALGGPDAKRYPAEVAPFVAVGEPTEAAAQALAELVPAGEAVDIVGLSPKLDAGWELLGTGNIVQMVWRQDAPAPRLDPIDVLHLGKADIEDMLALTAVVYPAYFRARTPEMGDYYGIRQADHLCAMAGERMKMHDFVEISAVCTHPDHTGRGYAARLLNHIVAKQLQRGVTPILHVDEGNARARSLYARLGFVDRAILPLWLVRRR